MKGSYKSGRPQEFTRAYWEQLRDTEQRCQVDIRCTVHLSHQRGVLTVELAAVGLEERPGGAANVRMIDDWPSAREQTFEAFMYSLAFRLAAMVEAWRQSREHEQRAARV